MSKWKKARKKPIIIEYRDPIPKDEVLMDDVLRGKKVYVSAELIRTREGALYGFPGRDYIIRGVRGEIYPIGIDIFNETYDVIEADEENENISYT